MALAGVVNGIWDLWARYEGKPLWRLVSEMPPEEILKVIPFKYISDVLTWDEALKILKEGQKGKEERIRQALNNVAVPAYTTSAGWIAYSDEKVKRRVLEDHEKGFQAFKMKVGLNIDDDKRRLALFRSIVPNTILMVDANQVETHSDSILIQGVGRP